MSRILVTGASGFVGRPLTVALTKCGYSVRGTYRHVIEPSADIDARAIPDLNETIDWPALLDGIDTVVHLAGIAHLGPEISEAEYHRVNCSGTAILAKAAKAAGVKRFVFMSSIRAQSGPSASTILTEASRAEPTDPYGRSKLAAEEAIRSSGVSYTILRPVLIYGPDVKGNLDLLKRLAELPIPLPLAALSGRRSLVSIRNLTDAVTHSIVTPACANETFIVADPKAVTLPEIIMTLRAAAGRQPRLFSIPPQLIKAAFLLTGRGDLWSRVDGDLEVSAAKLIATGWTPESDTERGLATMRSRR